MQNKRKLADELEELEESALEEQAAVKRSGDLLGLGEEYEMADKLAEKSGVRVECARCLSPLHATKDCRFQHVEKKPMARADSIRRRRKKKVF